jgi:hypothetical protein
VQADVLNASRDRGRDGSGELPPGGKHRVGFHIETGAMTRPKSQTKALGDLVNALVPHSGVVTGGGKPAEFAEELAQSPV